MLEEYPDILTIKDVQAILSIGRTKAYSLLHNDNIHYITIGRQIRIPKKYLLDYLSDIGYDIGMKRIVCCQERSE